MKAGITSKSSTRLLVSVCLIVFITGICTIGVINWRMKTFARQEAREKAMLILDRNLAVHTYFSHQLKPALFKKLGPFVEEGYFDPVWMSSTYAVREMDEYYKSITGGDYYYKECAINARSPENEADAFERAFLETLNQPAQQEDKYAGVREINEKPFFVVLRKGEVMEQSCLRCHSTAKRAPAGLLEKYGPDRSFSRSVGEAVSAISIRIPLSAAYERVDRLILQLSLLFAAALLVVFGVAVYLNKRWIFDPLNALRLKAVEISRKPERVGEQIDLPSGIELSQLTEAFNAMSLQLRKERDVLEHRVEERTQDLNRTNSQLRTEIDERQKLISKLEKALTEIKTLRGILPICSHCKKIRDDKGYWNQLESYVRDHSDAEFSHGICPECMRKFYPDMSDEDLE
ncbi:MAG: c-type heme family protein [Thermodesulfobacteriota bacterium]